MWSFVSLYVLTLLKYRSTGIHKNKLNEILWNGFLAIPNVQLHTPNNLLLKEQLAQTTVCENATQFKTCTHAHTHTSVMKFITVHDQMRVRDTWLWSNVKDIWFMNRQGSNPVGVQLADNNDFYNHHLLKKFCICSKFLWKNWKSDATLWSSPSTVFIKKTFLSQLFYTHGDCSFVIITRVGKILKKKMMGENVMAHR